jgi:hypothetical protein
MGSSVPAIAFFLFFVWAVVAVAGLVAVLVGIAGSGYWIANGRPPRARFVRLCMVTSVVAVGIGAIAMIYARYVAPDSNVAYWQPVSLLAGGMVVVIVMLQWTPSDGHRRFGERKGCVAAWLLLVAVIWTVIAIGVFFARSFTGIGGVFYLLFGAAVVLVSLVMLIPLTVAVVRWYRDGGAGTYPVSVGFLVIGLIWLVALAIRFPFVVEGNERLRGSALVYWSIGSLPTVFAWFVAALTSRTRQKRALAAYVAVWVVLSLVLGGIVGQVTGYVTCDLKIFSQPCHSWSQTGRTLGAGVGIALAAFITVAIYGWRHVRVGDAKPKANDHT